MTRARASRSPFFVYLSLGFLAIALAGFSTTLFIPLAAGTFEAPRVVHVHGILMFGWLLFFLAQTLLITTGNPAVHRRLGWFGAALAGAIAVSGVLVGIFATRRDLAAEDVTWPYGAFVNITIEMVVFGTLVGLAILRRRHPASHKRFLVLATISALGPAWFRFRHFMPFVPNPLVTFSLVADSVLLLVIAWDWLAVRRVDPVYLWGGGAMVCVHLVELAAGESALWVGLGRWLLQGPTA